MSEKPQTEPQPIEGGEDELRPESVEGQGESSDTEGHMFQSGLGEGVLRETIRVRNQDIERQARERRHERALKDQGGRNQGGRR